MNRERFTAANILALITHTITQPLDMIKIRSQMLQEGKTFVGLGFQRGWYPFQIMEELSGAGGGLKKYYSSIDAFVARTVGYTTARIYGFGYFYDKFNPDPRRVARADYFLYAGVLGGFVAGAVTNPLDVVFDRMQVDEMYPEQARRNYRNFLDGLYKVCDEGAAFRGAIANGVRIAAICSSMTGLYDLCKENSYFFFGPHWINRLWSTLVASLVGTLVSMPFDNIRVRLHTMRPLPNGQYPYNGMVDCLQKIIRYECNPKYQNNMLSLFAGFEVSLIRLFLICYVSQLMLDYYHGRHYIQEFWQPARYHFQTGIDYDIHDPYTDAFNKHLVASYTGQGGLPAASPNGKTGLTII